MGCVLLVQMSLSKPAKFSEERLQPSPRKERKNQKDLDKALNKVYLSRWSQNKASHDPAKELPEQQQDDQGSKDEVEALRKQLAEAHKKLALLEGGGAKNKEPVGMASLPKGSEGEEISRPKAKLKIKRRDKVPTTGTSCPPTGDGGGKATDGGEKKMKPPLPVCQKRSREMEDPVESSLEAKSKRDKKTQQRVCLTSVVQEAERLVGQEFTLAVGCEESAGKGKCAVLTQDEFLQSDCCGQTVFLSPPPHKVQQYVAHYCESKKRAPYSTSCVLIIPGYEKFDAKSLDFRIVGKIPKKSRLYIPILEGRARTDTRVLWDPPSLDLAAMDKTKIGSAPTFIF